MGSGLRAEWLASSAEVSRQSRAARRRLRTSYTTSELQDSTGEFRWPNSARVLVVGRAIWEMAESAMLTAPRAPRKRRAPSVAVRRDRRDSEKVRK